ncbi:MAG TPA: ATP synthase F0 subunit B [Chloroflexi bacterium]|nr:ATP synthase F0 subunit B [Chloroflexota bacterium]
MEALEGLGINPGFLLSQVVNFLILFAGLYFLLWKPILKMLDERKERIQQGLEDAERAKEERERAQAEFDKRLEEAAQERERIIARAREEAQEERKAILAEAEQEAERALIEAREEAQLERERILEELRGQVAVLAIAAANRLIGEALDEERQRRLVDEFFSGISAGRVQIIDEAELAVGDTNARVTSALPLTEEEKATLASNLAARLGTEPQLEFDVDPAILGGLVLKVGDRVIDGSVAGKLEALRERLV